jgi:anti-sigma factor RsiW
MFRAHHVHEERLFECYLTEREGASMEPLVAEHLADCPECAHRYADLLRFMDELRQEADTELDEVFSVERRRAQQQQIARRLEQVGHAARIISFPGHPPADHHALPRRPRVAPRWLAAAAAIGLIVGASLGGVLFRDRPATPVQPPPVVGNVGPVEPAFVETRASEPANDVDFLSELEIALERPYTPELVALDALTPHVREVRITRVSR